MLQVFLSECCKSRSGVAHIVMGPTCYSCWAPCMRVESGRMEREASAGMGSGGGWQQGRKQSPLVCAAGCRHGAQAVPRVRAANL
jgi:hypothetical protein